MAELDFFIAPEKAESLIIKHLLFEGYAFVPAMLYPSNKIIILNEFSELIEFAKMERHFYVTHPNFTKHEFLLRKINKNGLDCFYIVDKFGGPYLEIFLPVQYFENNILHYSSGFIAKFNKYYLPKNGDNILIGDNGASKAYKDICGHIIKNTILIRNLSKRAFRISKEVIHDIKNGAKLAGFSDQQLQEILPSITEVTTSK